MDVNEICGTYSLTHLNGAKAPAKGELHLYRDGDDLRIVITVANTLRGKVQYENSKLSGVLMSTMMMGDENQMIVEDAISGGFGTGFAVRTDNGRLLLKNESNALIFIRTMRLDDIFGTHSIVTIDGQTPPESLTMKFLPDGNGGSFVIANITNTLRGDCTVVGGVLQGQAASTNLQADSRLAAIEAQISTDLCKGYRISKNESGILLTCNDSTIQLYHVLSREELSGEYLLKAFNGQPVHTTTQPLVSLVPNDESDLVKVFVVVANRIRGSVALSRNVLKSDEPLLSTRMLGTEEEGQLEAAFNAGFQCGLEVSLKGNILTLKDDDNVFVFTRVAEVQGENGQPTYKGTYACKCFKTQGNGLLFRIVNELENKWAFYNDTKDYQMHVQATFGSRSGIEPLDNTKLTQSEDGKKIVEVVIAPQSTEMFISGDVNGFKVLYSAEPI